MDFIFFLLSITIGPAIIGSICTELQKWSERQEEREKDDRSKG